MTRVGHIPIRSCIGCGAKAPAKTLVRFVIEENRVVIDHGKNKPGRGCYLCHDEQCLGKAFKRKAFPRFLRKKNVKFDHLLNAFTEIQDPLIGSGGTV